MVTNLVFKRTVQIEGSSRTEMKIIEVNIPELKSNEGWTLVSCADKVSTINLPRETGKKSATTTVEDESITEAKDKEDITKNRDAEVDTATDFLNNLIAGMNQATAGASCNCAQTDESILERFKEQLAAQSVNIAYKPEPNKPVEYESPIQGTACLIRAKNTIRIAYRNGKKAQINNPNKVCITDSDKQHFFNAVRAANGGNDHIKNWVLKENNHYYDIWNKFIDDEYIQQRDEYLRKGGRI